jgi:hypothetical protein
MPNYAADAAISAKQRHWPPSGFEYGDSVFRVMPGMNLHESINNLFRRPTRHGEE